MTTQTPDQTAKAEAIRPRVHGNGFIQLDLSKSERLHVFGDSRIPHQQTPTPIHNHTFGFTSRIISGELTNVWFDVVEDPRGTHQVYTAKVRQGEDTVLESNGVVVKLIERSRKTFRAGDTYSMVAGEFHETITPSRTVTIITKNGPTLSQGGPSPSILCLIGQMPDNNFNRYSVAPDKLWEIICSVDQAECERLRKRCDMLINSQGQDEETRQFLSDKLHLAEGVADAVVKERDQLRSQLALANDAATKGEAGRNLGTALEEAVKENAELRAERDELRNQIKEANDALLLKSPAFEGTSAVCRLLKELRTREAALMALVPASKKALDAIQRVADITDETRLGWAHKALDEALTTLTAAGITIL